MKKANKPLVAVAVLLLVTFILGAAFYYLREQRFTFDSADYGTADIVKLEPDELKQMITTQSSFGLFVSQPACRASADLAKILQTFTQDFSLRIYEIDFSALRDSNLIPELKFYPSFVIYHNGTVIDFLDAGSDDDTAAYNSVTGFEDWLGQYVIFDR